MAVEGCVRSSLCPLRGRRAAPGLVTSSGPGFELEGLRVLRSLESTTLSFELKQ